MKSTGKLTDGEGLLKILSEQAPVGVCLMQDGKFSYVNSFFSRATGYPADELVSKDSLGIVAPEDRDMVRQNTINPGMIHGDILRPQMTAMGTSASMAVKAAMLTHSG